MARPKRVVATAAAAPVPVEVPIYTTPEAEQPSEAPATEPQPPQDNDHVAPSAELFIESVEQTEPAFAPDEQDYPEEEADTEGGYPIPPAEWKYDAPSADPLPPLEIEALPDYLARIEQEAQPLPVCEVTHPDAIDGTVHTGTYAGIRLVCGFPIQALLSDGSKI